MAAAFRAHGLGLILDIVPNHMGIGGAANRFWLDVLEWGEASPYAPWFDIDWASTHPGLAGKVLVPFLGAAYADVLADGGLALRFDPAEGSFAVWAHDSHKLPICPRHYGTILRAGGLAAEAAAFDAAAPLDPADRRWSELKAGLAAVPQASVARALAAFAGTPGDPATWSRLDALIAAQHWRAAKFNLDGDAINYRRFFTISDLAGVRVELPEVFDATHRLVLSLLDEGLIDGVRIDHIDGLRDPKAYTLRLRSRVARPFTLHVEKILAADEDLPADWQSDGTTGYEVANLLVGLLADPAGTDALTRTYADFTGRAEPPAEVVHAAKRAILARPMAAELEAIAARLLPARAPRAATSAAASCAPASPRSSPRSTSTAPTPTPTACPPPAAPASSAPSPRPAGATRRSTPASSTSSQRVARRSSDPEALDSRAMRVQQLTGPAMAKGLEDTALYRYNRLIALNEVGSEPGALHRRPSTPSTAPTPRASPAPRARCSPPPPTTPSAARMPAPASPP